MAESDNALSEVKSTLDAELKKAKQHIALLSPDPCVFLMGAVRMLDHRAVSSALRKDGSGRETHVDDEILRFGFNPLLEVLMPMISRDAGMPLAVMTDEVSKVVGSALYQLGRVRLLQRYIQLVNSGAMSLERSGTSLDFRTVDDFSHAEAQERIDRAWIANKLRSDDLKPSDGMLTKMSSLVYQWKTHFIGYGADPEIDDHFLVLSVRLLEEQRDVHGIHPDFSFGSMKGRDLYLVATVLCSFYMKHLAFCLEYMRKYPSARLDNVLTIWTTQKDMTGAVASFIKGIDAPGPERKLMKSFSLSKVHRCLSALTLDAMNYAHHASRFRTPMPPLIAVRRNFWIRPVSSVLDNPLGFGARELRRLLPKAWDKSIRAREEWFRRDLYGLFAGNRYVLANREMQLAISKRTVTDIDAAIVDIKTGKLALFELKWQEPIGFEESERKNRARNLRSEVLSWVNKVRQFLFEQGKEILLEQLRIPVRLHSAVSAIELFVVVRHNARFTGVSVTHPEAVVASWAQFQRARMELGSVGDTFGSLFGRLKMEEGRGLNVESEVATFSVAGFNVRADHFVVLSESDQPPSPANV